jgi:hypothetical protein
LCECTLQQGMCPLFGVSLAYVHVVIADCMVFSGRGLDGVKSFKIDLDLMTFETYCGPRIRYSNMMSYSPSVWTLSIIPSYKSLECLFRVCKYCIKEKKTLQPASASTYLGLTGGRRRWGGPAACSPPSCRSQNPRSQTPPEQGGGVILLIPPVWYSSTHT